MANLFWKNKQETKSLLETPFKLEEELEILLFDTSELMEDIYLIKRQVRGGGKSGIPDIVGVDNDGNICILEIKNKPVSTSIIPQVLEYALWAETNPDSIKSLWLESASKPDDISIDWEQFEVRILIIAPAIHSSTLDFVEKINYPVDLIEVKRWIDGDDQLIMVNKLEQEKKSKIRPAKGLQTYDESFYLKHKNSKSAKEFIKYATEVDNLVRSKDWALDKKFTKSACVFKAGVTNVFMVRWIGTKTFAFIFKISKSDADRLMSGMTRYNERNGRAIYYIENGKTKTRDFLPLFEYTYKSFAG